MGVKIIEKNFRVEVEPETFRWQSERDIHEQCESVADQIRRHVDGLSRHGNRGVRVISDRESVCEHCGAKWTEADHLYNGGCCQKDVEADAALTTITEKHS